MTTTPADSSMSLQDFFGGITIFTSEQFAAVNGYGTLYWGWGRWVQGVYSLSLPASVTILTPLVDLK